MTYERLDTADRDVFDASTGGIEDAARRDLEERGEEDKKERKKGSKADGRRRTGWWRRERCCVARAISWRFALPAFRRWLAGWPGFTGAVVVGSLSSVLGFSLQARGWPCKQGRASSQQEAEKCLVCERICI